jgi:hypothetical protein
MEPADILQAGIRELDAIMVPNGFAFKPGQEGRSSGGKFAYGEYYRGNRRLILHFRWSLGLVTYHVRDVFLDHEGYVRALFGLSKVQGHNSYPGFSTDPLDGFRHLREDLERFGEVFLKGSDEEFRALKNWIDVHPKVIGLRGLLL